MRHPRAPGGSNAEEIVRHRKELRRLDKEPAKNNKRRESGSMPSQTPACEYREPGSPGNFATCRAGLYGGKVTDGMCRLCIKRGDKPAAIIRLPRVAIGDAVERVLTAVGVTKERVQQWTGSKDCGCKQRKGWLNKWGYQKQAQAERLLQAVARWYGIG